MTDDLVAMTENETKVSIVVGKKRKGFFARLLSFLARRNDDDFEKRLQHISKEESVVLERMKRRSLTWRKMAKHLIILSVIFEVIAVGYAIMTTRSIDLNWKMRAFRVLPMFLLPGLSSVAYSTLISFTRMCNHKDQKVLERLRAERQAKIDELKEKTNYYTTQQLIQRYDSDPAAKAAAATVLASKLGADSGLKVYVGDKSELDVHNGTNDNIDPVRQGGLRNRKRVHDKWGNEEVKHLAEKEGTEETEGSKLVVEHQDPQASLTVGGWIPRIVALLVGEDPMQSYALICGSCHQHNGLARKEDFAYVTYYCPHCHALNQPKQSGEHTSPTAGASSDSPSPLEMEEATGIKQPGPDQAS